MYYKKSNKGIKVTQVKKLLGLHAYGVFGKGAQCKIKQPVILNQINQYQNERA